MENLQFWKKWSDVPAGAKKRINGGRLNGMTDIKPTWRYHVLTEVFGPCGLGWKVKKLSERFEISEHDGTVSVFVDAELYFKYDDRWSEPIPGTGGSSFISKERKGLYTSDEAIKMAFTDAISVCCKFLGIGASVYTDGRDSKYGLTNGEAEKTTGVKKQDFDTKKAVLAEIFLREPDYKSKSLWHFKAQTIDDLEEKAIDVLLKRASSLGIDKKGGGA